MKVMKRMKMNALAQVIIHTQIKKLFLDFNITARIN